MVRDTASLYAGLCARIGELFYCATTCTGITNGRAEAIFEIVIQGVHRLAVEPTSTVRPAYFGPLCGRIATPGYLHASVWVVLDRWNLSFAFL